MTTPVPTPPKTKFGRQKVLIAGAGLVLLVFLFMRSRGAQAAAPAQDPNATVAQPATFADNGAQAASLGDSVTSGLGNVAGSLQDEQLAFQSLADALNANAGTTPAAPTTPSSTVGTGAPTPTPTPSMVMGGSPLQPTQLTKASSGKLVMAGPTPTPTPGLVMTGQTIPRQLTPAPAARPPRPSHNAGHRHRHHTGGGGGGG